MIAIWDYIHNLSNSAMKQFQNIPILFSMATIWLVSGSCTDDVVSDVNPADRVRFSVSPGAGWQEGMSRGASISSMEDQSISVTAFAFKSWDDSLYPNFMIDEELGSPWVTDRYWPNTGLKLQFFAHCPYSPAGWKRQNEPGYPKYAYTVPKDAAGQSDILVASTPELSRDPKGEVSLKFQHVLSRISFNAAPGFETGTVRSVTLKGVYGAGVFSFADSEWSGLSNPTDFENEIDKEVTEEGGSLLSDELTFMMIPQTFPSDSEASVEISFTDGATGAAHTLSFSLKGHEWGKGKTVNYRLSH